MEAQALLCQATLRKNRFFFFCLHLTSPFCIAHMKKGASKLIHAPDKSHQLCSMSSRQLHVRCSRNPVPADVCSEIWYHNSNVHCKK